LATSYGSWEPRRKKSLKVPYQKQEYEKDHAKQGKITLIHEQGFVGGSNGGLFTMEEGSPQCSQTSYHQGRLKNRTEHTNIIKNA